MVTKSELTAAAHALPLLDLAKQVVHGSFTPGVEDVVLLERCGDSDLYPMQPMYEDKTGVIRFEANPIIDHIACEVFGLNEVAVWCAENDIDDKYQEQLAQLIGYSVSGYGNLGYVSDESCDRADKKAEDMQ